ncbi:MAG: polyprenyl synthetase family protein [Planctomycetota bacterium]|nr:polyprenyl synthetase family protein [Planctomycetota bacterium]
MVEAVASSVTARVQRLAHAVGWDIPSPALIAGQMLRTRLAGRIAQRRAPLDRADLVSLCAATELLHLANLCHDNVADNPRASQRPRPVWLTRGASTAVLLGDLLLVDATQIVVATRGGRHVKSFLDKAKEVLESEVQQEVHGPAMAADLAHCQRRARGKSGPLFAFTAALGGADEPPLARALEEAGYQIGTACQLADDFLDPTRQDRSDVRREAQERVAALCAAALEALTPWPGVQTGLAKFLVHDLAPARAPEATPRPAPVQTPA